jgi:hypothetical protein
MYIEIERRTAIVREFGAAQCGRRSREGHVKAGLDVRYPFDLVECGNPDAPPIAKNLFSDARSASAAAIRGDKPKTFQRLSQSRHATLAGTAPL